MTERIATLPTEHEIDDDLAMRDELPEHNGQQAGGSEEYTFSVGDADHGSRLDLFLGKSVPDLSREKLKKIIREGGVTRNGTLCQTPKTVLKRDDTVAVRYMREASSLTAEEGEVALLYKDDAVAVIDKPPYLTVHPCPSCPEGTLAHRLVGTLPELSKMEGLRPGIVHRLDKDTSGLMLVALTEPVRLALQEDFAAHAVKKEYLAFIRGIPDKIEDTIDEPIGRNPSNKVKMAVVEGGRNALSSYRVLFADPDKRFSLVAVRIHTGRTHQIRVHMAYIGHPLLGDKLYSEKDAKPANTRQRSASSFTSLPAHKPATRKTTQTEQHMLETLSFVDPAQRQMLHAWRLSFAHPCPEALHQGHAEAAQHALAERDGVQAIMEIRGNTLSFQCPPPDDFLHTASALGTRCLRVVLTGMPGCGKSTVLAQLGEAGIPVFSSDAVVKKLYGEGGDGYALLQKRFGDRFLDLEKHKVNTTALGEAMRESDGFRREIEGMIHPLVSFELDKFWHAHTRNDLAVAEIPLYFETLGTVTPHQGQHTAAGKTQSGTSSSPTLEDSLCVVTVHCPFTLRKQRLATIRHWGDEVIAMMESWQWPEEKKKSAADMVVENTGTPADLVTGTHRLLQQLIAEKKNRQSAFTASVADCWREPFTLKNT